MSRLTNSEAKACPDLVERFGALRPDERWMTAPRGESGRPRGRLNSAGFCYSGRLTALSAATPLFATRSPARQLFCHRTINFEGAPRALEVPRRPLGRDLPQPLRSRQMPAARWLLIRLVRTKQLTDVYASSTSLSCFAIRALTTCLAGIASLKPGVEAAEATRCSVRADGGRAGPP